MSFRSYNTIIAHNQLLKMVADEELKKLSNDDDIIHNKVYFNCFVSSWIDDGSQTGDPGRRVFSVWSVDLTTGKLTEEDNAILTYNKAHRSAEISGDEYRMDC